MCTDGHHARTPGVPARPMTRRTFAQAGGGLLLAAGGLGATTATATSAGTAPTGGFPEGKGRTGLWVTDHNRDGVRRAVRARRFFATAPRGSGSTPWPSLVAAGRPAWARCCR